ncbi:MAG: hypothetical protein WKF59_12965 [Chitinophagaceae bacterium]
MDPTAMFSVTPDIILHHHKTTPYLNEKLFGVVEQTYLSGEKVFDAGKFLHLNKGKINFISITWIQHNLPLLNLQNLQPND